MKALVQRLTGFLDDSLRRKKYQGNPCHLTGHCYVACEVIFHLYPGRYKPCFVRHEGEPHWFLRDRKTNKVVDPTVGQFKTTPDYDSGRGIGFLTANPSKRAQKILAKLLDQGK